MYKKMIKGEPHIVISENEILQAMESYENFYNFMEMVGIAMNGKGVTYEPTR